MHLRTRTTITAVLGAGLLLTTAACGGGDDPLSDSGDESSDAATDGGSPASTAGGPLTISGQDFTESEVMAQIYNQLLSDAGYDVTVKLVGTRNIYFDQLSQGKVDVVPDYLSGIGDYLNIEANGADAEPITSPSTEESLQVIEPLATDAGITLLDPAEANSQNGFAVTSEFAEENDLTTLTDLGERGEPIKLAAASDCEGRSDCEGGLSDVYGIDISEIVPLGYGGQPTMDAVQNGEVELGEFGTTDATVEANGLVFLEDDQDVQPAQNLTPAVNSDFLDEHPDVADTLNALSAVLTTDKLAELDERVTNGRELAEDVAADFVESEGLV